MLFINHDQLFVCRKIFRNPTYFDNHKRDLNTLCRTRHTLYVYVNTKARSRIIVAVEIKICYTLVCVCARVLGSVHVRACSLAYLACDAYALCCDVICGPSGSTTFSALSHKWYDFRKKSH
jgi:hypothetical protein